MRLRVPAFFLCLAAFPAEPPPTPKHPVTDIYNGVSVTDDYRWLEDWSDPAVRAWSDAQNRFARRYLDSLPTRAALSTRIRSLLVHRSPRFFDLTRRASSLFALERDPSKQQPLLVVLASASDPSSARPILDPNVLDPSGLTEIDFYVPSLDGRYVAVSLSHGGSEAGDLRLYSTATAQPLPDAIPRVNRGTAGGSVAWTPSGFFYTRYPSPGERPPAGLDFFQQVWFHSLGSPVSSDRLSLGKDFPRIAEITLRSSSDGLYVLARMANGDGGDFAHYLYGPSGKWTRFASFADQVSDVRFGPNGSLFLLSHLDAPMGKILKTPLSSPDASSASPLIPESKASIVSFLPAKNYLYVHDSIGGPSQIRVFDPAGRLLATVPILPVSSVLQMLRGPSGSLLFENTGYLDPPSWFSFDPATGKLSPTALKQTSPADFSGLEVVRDFAVSRDGAQIPLTVIRPKGAKLDGRNPTLLTGYGGYGISLTPRFVLEMRPLFDHGFVFAIANLRGGGEYGEAWHRAGMLTKKQNVFDDFTACARYLVSHRYTTAAHLAIEGGSNGGLLMGAAFTQNPDLYRAVVSHVGIYDMLRVELSPNGAFNVTEFGTVKEQDQFRALFAYSPYHHVVRGTQYPAILFLTGANDPRVDPANSRKMTALLQASGSRLPVYLRTSSNSGHGIGSSLDESIAELTDVDAFLLDQLHVP